jgi:Cof subfamily protein (haloacid dehalogenase superfamily)
VREALSRARDGGMRLAICTGRPLASVVPLAASVGIEGPQIAFNGALVKDPRADQAVFRRPLAPGALDRLIVLGREAGVALELYTEATHYVERDWEESRRHAASIHVGYRIASFDTFFGRTDIIKAQIVTGDERAKAATRRIAEELEGALRFSVALPIGPAAGLECVNVVDATVSKGEAVEHLIVYYGLAREAVAGAGDALNDLPMLEQVGLKIAMGNAEPEVKAVADIVCGDVDDDGLIEAIAALR